MRRFHELPEEEYARLDIGEVNLECAFGLEGSENLDVRRGIATLDKWAALVADRTEQYFGRFLQKPGDFFDSEAYFRMLVLVTVLQRDLGVRYATDTLEGPFDATDSRLHFLHGSLKGAGAHVLPCRCST
jgi:hypothetical protein